MIYLNRTKLKRPERGKGVRIALYQGECPAGTAEAIRENISKLEAIAKEASAMGVQALSFPELYLSGYALNLELVRELAEEVDGASMTIIAGIAKKYHIAIICPYPERDCSSGCEIFYDSIACFDNDGNLLHNYRKVHLFGEAEKINFTSGYAPEDNADALFPVLNVANFPLGILNCYEAEFPELARLLALKGAKLIIIPTAADYFYTLPDGRRTSVPYPDVSKTLLPAHSYENHIFIAYINRYGYETVNGNSWHYRGNSVICGPHGWPLLAARPEETLLVCDIIPEDFGPTHPEGDYLTDRIPELYQMLSERNNKQAKS